MTNPKSEDTAFWPRPSLAGPQQQETGPWVFYLEERVSTLQSGWAQGGDGAESAPEVDAGQQGARCQQDGCLQCAEQTRSRRMVSALE